uniref:Uncharacterized protein n=1 Tax=viral metagenome TaxID=1070528 RepID=A0A6C0FB18_9ZZZZ|tara:strand:- start:558 stop:1010 length:453 start_codon:yes stop_codon:yes gene_type:complete
MENKETEYIDGDADDFTIYLFSKEPQEKNSIKLELSKPDKDIKIGLHIFQELLMIFTAGMKYLYANGKESVNINELSMDDIKNINKYIASIGFIAIVEKFTIEEYLSNMKLPNYFVNKELIKDDTLLRDIYYEVTVNSSMIYRISFDFLK